jgi:Rha family phage regulatory protein
MQNQLVHQSGDRIVVTTLEISNHFGRQHKNVMLAIQNLECSDKFNRLNFKPISYNDGRNRPQPAYELTRDGFTFLCMGFTGQQAAVWKERYIDAFNQMEAALRGDLPALRKELPLALENGHLKDQVRARDAIIQAKDGVIMGLQDKLIGSQGRQIRLIGQVAAMQKRQRDREIIQLIERMESEGKPRSEIVEMTGKPLNYIRQRVFIARNEGRIGGAA